MTTITVLCVLWILFAGYKAYRADKAPKGMYGGYSADFTPILWGLGCIAGIIVLVVAWVAHTI